MGGILQGTGKRGRGIVARLANSPPAPHLLGTVTLSSHSVRLTDASWASPQEVLGALTAASDFPVDPAQRDAWLEEVVILKQALEGLQGTLHLEFTVPRIGSRIDAVVISGPVVFVLEFKVGASEYLLQDRNQAWDYALDLKNFHSASHQAPIIPILIATEAEESNTSLPVPHPDGVHPPAHCNRDGIRRLLDAGLAQYSGPAIDGMAWASAPYRPTPTIIEAAQALFAGHSVEAIARHGAGIKNLSITSRSVEQVVEAARDGRQKCIVFVTGVPGAGKTLVGLNVATKRRDERDVTHAVFLTGNAPLVKVLHEALTRDEYARRQREGKEARKGDIRQKVKAFIQNVHHFRDAGLQNEALPPADHVVIFDEAQRAWDLEMTADFMRRKKKRPGFSQSEPEFLLSYLDRHADWAAVICLVGGGQEINRGEAGISAWLDAVREKYPEWRVFISSELTDSEYAAGHALEALAGRANVVNDPDLHLAVSVRSFRAEKLSHFVKAVLDCDRPAATALLRGLHGRYPIVLTRDLERAKRWIRAQARGTERFGLVASSGAQRLKPHAIDIRVEVDPVNWFLNDADDTRSSYYLEDAATEFQVQGLELDWTCVTWDADLRFGEQCWAHHEFRGSKWNRVKAPERQQYLKNAYRVLLTRARQGMVIFVPPGDAADPTRPPAFYDATFEYLREIGLPVVPA
ncbi:MAG: DUF2075 domain-containing protein [Gemmatimonadetes bacterium]|nr:DUF2075 domain-containing protein [Gemmatimonadota bacterium]MBK9691236.1 DUF2075 domain-containing protein [Gemmatimonadota bacterium]